MFDGLDPAEIQRRIQEGVTELDYRPDIERVKPPGTPGDYQIAQSSLNKQYPVGDEHPAKVHMVNMLATWHDVLAVGTWLNQTQLAYEEALKDVVIPMQSDVLSPAQQASLTTLLGHNEITFFDYQNSLLNTHVAYRGYVMKAWNKYHFSYDGRADALFYADIVRLNTIIYPNIQSTAKALIFATTNVILGYNDDGSLNVTPHLEAMQTRIADDSDYTIPSSAITGLTNMQGTVIAATSEIVDIGDQQQQLYTSQQNLCSNAGDLVNNFQDAINSSSNQQGLVGTVINIGNELLGVLRGVRTLFQLYNDGASINFLSLEAKLDQIIESFILQIVAQGAAILAHLQASLMQPLTAMIMKIDGTLHGRASQSWQGTANELTKVIESLVGKQNQHILDWYRHQWLHKQLTGDKIVAVHGNQHQKNILKILDEVIAFLENAEGNNIQFVGSENSDAQTTGWQNVVNTICENASVQPLVAPPATPARAIITPPIGTDLTTLTAKTKAKAYGLRRFGTAREIANGLVSDIGQLS